MCISSDDAKMLHCLFQLLDLMHTLHTKAAAIFTGWAQEAEAAHAAVDSSSHGSVMTVEEIDAGTSTLWMTCWCPLLQGKKGFMFRFCCMMAYLVKHRVCDQ